MSKGAKKIVAAFIVVPFVAALTWYVDTNYSNQIIPDTQYLQSLSMLKIIELNKKYGVTTVSDIFNPDQPSEFTQFLDGETTVKKEKKAAMVTVNNQEAENEIITKINGEYILFEGVDPSADLNQASQEYSQVNEVAYAEPNYILKLGLPNLSASVTQAQSPLDRLRARRAQLQQARARLVERLARNRSQLRNQSNSSTPASPPIVVVPTPTPVMQAPELSRDLSTLTQSIFQGNCKAKADNIVSQIVDINFSTSRLQTPARQTLNIASVDSGADNPECMNGHFVFDSIIPSNSQRDSSGKVIPVDINGHGTHVTGLFMAVINHFIQGTNITVNYFAMQGFDGDTASLTDFARAVDIEHRLHNIDLFNFSFGTINPSDFLRDTISRLDAAGVVVVAAAGNNGNPSQISDPALRETVLSVRALETRAATTLASFSNNSVKQQSSAVGRRILSFNGRKSGTSQAAPLTAGIVALRMLIDGNAYSHQRFLANCTSGQLNELDVEKCLE